MLICLCIFFKDFYADYSSYYETKKDFRSSQQNIYNIIYQLCILANSSVYNNIRILLSSASINNQLISLNQFNREINQTLDNFQTKTINTFTQTLDLIRTSMQGNAFVTLLETNWQFVIIEEQNTIFSTIPVVYNNTDKNSTICSCATSRNCIEPARLFADNGTAIYTMEGFVLGCYFLETVLHTSLSCLYSISCINEFRQAYVSLPNAVENDDPALNISFNSKITRFNVEHTIEILASQMFIESWTSNISYERYFNSCAPNYCTYTYYYRFDAFDVLTTFLSIFSGLSVGLRFIVPHLVEIFTKIRNHFRIAPTLIA